MTNEIPEKFRSVGYFWSLLTCAKVLRELRRDFPETEFVVRLQIIEVEK